MSYIASVVDVNKIDFSKPVYQIYTENPENSDTLVKKIGAECSSKENICPVIGTHIGSDAAGIVFAEK